jgi:hypothetical protein
MLHSTFDSMFHSHIILCFIIMLWIVSNNYFLFTACTSLHYLFYLCFAHCFPFYCFCFIGFIWQCYLITVIITIFCYFLSWRIQTWICGFRSFFRWYWVITANSFRFDDSSEYRLNSLEIVVSFMCTEYDRWHWLEYGFAFRWCEIDINKMIDTAFDIGDDEIDLTEKIREVANHLILVLLHQN